MLEWSAITVFVEKDMSIKKSAVDIKVDDKNAFKMRLMPFEEIYLDLKEGAFISFTFHPLAEVLNQEIFQKHLTLRQDDEREFVFEADDKIIFSFTNKDVQEEVLKKAKITALFLRQAKFLKAGTIEGMHELKEFEANQVQCVEGYNLIGCGQLQRAFLPKLKHVIIPFEERGHPHKIDCYFLRGTPNLQEFYAPFFENYQDVVQAHPNKKSILMHKTLMSGWNVQQQR